MESANPWLSWSYVQDNSAALVSAGIEHLWITVASMALGIVMAVPLTLLARRHAPWAPSLLSGSGILYTIPSLALISALWPLFGLTNLTVIVALALYALLILLRGALLGLDEVPADVVDAARGMGMSDREIMVSVEFPLALPTILSGLRVATVSTVGLVTVGALVGHGGFGTLILGGLNENFYHAKIFTATIACVALALILDFALRALERGLTPWAKVAV
ncbi:MAG: ABC transporter permease [Actinomycetes bacterium]